MQYLKLVEGVVTYPYGLWNLRIDFPNVSFMQPYESNDLSYFGVFPVQPTEKPVINKYTQYLVELDPQEVEGQWVQIWEIRNYTAEEITANLSSARASIWEDIKKIRDRKLQLGGFSAAGKWFHSDTFSRSQFLALARKADKIEVAAGNMNEPFLEPGTQNPLMWKTLDGSFIAITPTVAQAVVAAAEEQDAKLFKKAEILRATVNASQTPHTVDINSTWPDTFNGV